MISCTGSPPRLAGPKLWTIPVRSPRRPVKSAARLGVHTDAPTWKSVNRIPLAASLSRLGVNSGFGNFGSHAVVSPAQFAPMSP